MNPEAAVLTPAQKRALESLEHGLTVGDVIPLWGGSGMGKTTVLRELHRRTGGALIGGRDFAAPAREGTPDGLEESFARAIAAAAEKNDQEQLVSASDELTGADDAKAIYAYATTQNAPREMRRTISWKRSPPSAQTKLSTSRCEQKL